MNKSRILSWIIIAGLLIVFILAMTDNLQEQAKAEPVEVKTASITETKKLQKAVDDALAEKLSGEATVTIYYSGEDARCYRGELSYVDDGELHLILHADSVTSQADWW